MNNLLNDTARFYDLNVAANVNLAEDTATRKTGFDAIIGELDLVNPDADGVGEVVFTSELSGVQEVQEESVDIDASGTGTTVFTNAGKDIALIDDGVISSLPRAYRHE